MLSVKATEDEKKEAVEALTKYDMLTDDEGRQRLQGCLLYYRGGITPRRPNMDNVCGLLVFIFMQIPSRESSLKNPSQVPTAVPG